MCLPGTDDTETSCEEWLLLAPHKKQLLPLHWLEEGADTSPEAAYFCPKVNPTQYLFSDISWNSWARLARPSPLRHTHFSPLALPSSSRIHPSVKRSLLAPMECMPAELLSLILASGTLAKEDILALGLASSTLWPHAIEHIRTVCFAAAAPWAETPIACLGNYLLDLPLVLEADYPEPAGHDLIVYDDSDRGMFPCTFTDYVCWARKVVRAAVWGETAYRQVNVSESESDQWIEVLHAQFTNFKAPAPLMQQMERDIADCEPHFAPTLDEQWVLRNLTTREFVRCRAPIDGKTAHVDHTDAEWIRVDDVLMMRICWTKLDEWRHEQIEQNGLEAWERGAWAGHSFDIVALPRSKMLATVGGENLEDWKDVTIEVMEQAYRFRDALREWGEKATERRPRVVPSVTADQIHARIMGSVADLHNTLSQLASTAGLGPALLPPSSAPTQGPV